MDEPKKVSIIKNYLYNLSYQILLLIVPLITMPYLARTLGIDNQGTFSVIFAVINTFIMLGCVGLNIYGQREIAYYRHESDTCNRVFWEIELIRIVTLSFALIMYFAFVWLNINVKSLVNVDKSLYFILFSFEIIASMLDISWFYQGIENFRLQTIRNFAVKLIGLALILLLVKGRNDLWVYILIHVGMNIAGNGSLWFERLKSGKFVKPRKGIVSRHLGNSLIMFLPQIATTVYAQLDRVMVGGLINDSNFQAGVYDNAEKVVKIALTVVTSIGLVMLSRIANTYKRDERDKLKEYIKSSFGLYTCLSVPIMFGLAGIAEPFVILFFKGANGAEKITPVMLALCPIILLIGGSNVFGTQYLLPTNRMKPYTISVFAGMTVNVVFNLAFIPRWGALGAAFATVLAELSVLTAQLISVRKEFSIKLYLYAWRNFLSGAVMFVCVRLISKPFGANFMGIAIQISAGVIIYFSLLIILRDKFVLKYLKLITKKLTKR